MNHQNYYNPCQSITKIYPSILFLLISIYLYKLEIIFYVGRQRVKSVKRNRDNLSLEVKDLTNLHIKDNKAIEWYLSADNEIRLQQTFTFFILSTVNE